MERIMNNYKIFIVLAAFVILAMLTASCGAQGGAVSTTGSVAQGGEEDPPGSSSEEEDREFPDRKPPVDDPDNPGALTSFFYSCSSFFEGDCKYNIYQNDGNAFMLVKMEGGDPKDLACRVEMSVFDDITAILKEYRMFEWDGFNRYESEASDGYSFHLSAVFGERELIAAGYVKYPENYIEAHEALAGYLERLTESAEKPGITDKSEITQVGIFLGAGTWVSIIIFDSDAYISYSDAAGLKDYSLDDIGREKFEEFIDFACGFYDEYKDKSGMEGFETDSGGDWVTLEITAESKEFGTEIHCDIILDTVRNKEGCDELTEMTLWLVGKIDDKLGSGESPSEE